MIGFARGNGVDWEKIRLLIFWTSWTALVLWIIAKLLGLIQTPLWLELFPLIAVGIAILTFGMELGGWKHKIDFTYRKVMQHDKQLVQLHESLLRIEHKMDAGFAELRQELRGFRKDYDAHLKRYHT
jgi:hypothetical protein